MVVANSASRIALVPFFHGNWNLSSAVYCVRTTRASLAAYNVEYAFLICVSVAFSFAATVFAEESAAVNDVHPS